MWCCTSAWEPWPANRLDRDPKDSVRIQFVSLIPSYWGGSEVLWSEAAKALAQRQHAVSAFFALYREHPALTAVQAAGVQLSYGTPPPLRWWRRLTHRSRPRLQLLQHQWRRHRPNLVVFSQAAVRDGLEEMVACSARGLRYAIINQLVEPLLPNAEFAGTVRRAYQQATRIWFVSEENRETVEHFLGQQLPNAAVIPNAYACRHDCPTIWPATTLPLRAAMVARLEPDQKGHGLLLGALREPRWRERPLQISVFGEGPAGAELQRQVQEFGLRQITFRGCASPDEIWADHHALLLPSRYEGQSLSLLEAMLHGRPVITTPVAGTRAVVIDGVTGFRAQGFALEHWLEVLERAWIARASWWELGAHAAAKVRQHVWPEPGQRMADLIETLLQADAEVAR